MNETPSIITCNYSSGEPVWTLEPFAGWPPGVQSLNGLLSSEIPTQYKHHQQQQEYRQQATQPMHETKTPRRLVQVFIADTNENVPLEKCLLYSGTLKLTDLNDTELFFEIPINDLLKTHNEQRIKWIDKDASRKAGKDIFLEPVKIRELQMRVVNVAQF